MPQAPSIQRAAIANPNANAHSRTRARRPTPTVGRRERRSPISNLQSPISNPQSPSAEAPVTGAAACTSWPRSAPPFVHAVRSSQTEYVLMVVVSMVAVVVSDCHGAVSSNSPGAQVHHTVGSLVAKPTRGRRSRMTPSWLSSRPAGPILHFSTHHRSSDRAQIFHSLPARCQPSFFLHLHLALSLSLPLPLPLPYPHLPTHCHPLPANPSRVPSWPICRTRICIRGGVPVLEVGTGVRSFRIRGR